MYSLKRITGVNLLAAAVFAACVVFLPPTAHAGDEETPEIPQGSFDDEWALYLIDPENPLPEGYRPELELVYSSDVQDFYMDERCAGGLRLLMEDARADGIELVVSSAYRSYDRQEEIFYNYLNFLMGKGLDYEDAFAETAEQIAVPGASEHNSGLAVDFLTPDWFDTHDDITEDFEDTEAFRWLAKNAWKYGFILRYHKGEANTTGFIYEPWHYRYVGVDFAEQIYHSGLTLDAYISTRFARS